jgi:hypothetical protein
MSEEMEIEEELIETEEKEEKRRKRFQYL